MLIIKEAKFYDVDDEVILTSSFNGPTTWGHFITREGLIAPHLKPCLGDRSAHNRTTTAHPKD